MAEQSAGSTEPKLHDLVELAGAPLDPSALARVALAKVRRSLAVDGATLAFWDVEQQLLVPLAFDDPRVEGPDPVFRPSQGLIGEAFSRQAPVVVSDYRREIANPALWADVVSGVGVPLYADGRLVGALSAQSYQRREFTPAEVQALVDVAAQVGPSLGSMGTLARAQRQTAEAHALAALMRQGTALDDVDELFELVSNTAVRLLGADLVGVLMGDGPRRGSAWRGVVGNRTDAWRDPRYADTHPNASRIFGGSTLIHYPAQGPFNPEQYPFFAAEGIGVGISVPLDPADGTLGALCLGWRFDIELSQANLALAEALAGFSGTLVAAATHRAEREAAERELYRRTIEDDLTGLPNEAECIRRIAAVAQSQPVVAVVVDIRNFDNVNDAVGYEAADQLLVNLGTRLAQELGDAIVVGRIGGDGFAVAAVGSDPHALCARVRHSLEVPVGIGPADEISVDVRCGLALIPAGGDVDLLLRHADSALQVARRGTRPIVLWNARDAERRRSQHDIAQRLRRALDARSFGVAYQPIIDIGDGTVRRFEALARWPTAIGAAPSVTPDVFVPLAERLGRIGQLTAHVLDAALRDVVAAYEIPVSVNISPLDVMHGGLPRIVRGLLEAYGLPPASLMLEITEHAALEADDTGLHDLVAMGVSLSIDDFGRGWSSLEMLKRLPAADLKLDRSYVARASEDPTDAAIVQAAVTVGHSLGMQVVAEGIEDEVVLAAVERLGCDLAQGYHVARPMDATAVGDWLGAYRARPTGSNIR